MSNRQLYDQDFYAWANEQAGLLRAGRLFEADFRQPCPWTFDEIMDSTFYPETTH